MKIATALFAVLIAFLLVMAVICPLGCYDRPLWRLMDWNHVTLEVRSWLQH